MSHGKTLKERTAHLPAEWTDYDREDYETLYKEFNRTGKLYPHDDAMREVRYNRSMDMAASGEY